MISEAMGKILGMVLAYGVSALGLLLAYVNYRKRVVKADRVMTGTAWAVVAAVFVVIGLGVWVVAGLTEVQAPAPGPAEVGEAQVAETLAEDQAPPAAPAEPPSEWSLLGLVLPLIIFAFATWMTVALFKRFTHEGHHVP
jgi:hypothetical protein